MPGEALQAEAELERTLAALAPDIRHTVERGISARVERATNEAARRLQVAQEAGRVGTYEVDLLTGYARGSPQFYRAFGLPENTEAMRPGVWQTLIHPDDRERMTAMLGEVLRRGTDDNRHEYRVMVGGEVRWIRSCDRIERNAQGHAVVAFGAVIDITEEKANEAILWRAANEDHLTGLSNRRRFREALDQRLSAGERTGLLFVDLDRLKQANDMHGHEAGDHLIRAAAERLRACAGSHAETGRLGGDEFALTAAFQSEAELGAMGARLAEALSEPVRFNGATLDCGGSVGAALFPDCAGTTEALMRAADTALLIAKLTSRGRCRLWQPGDDAELARLARMKPPVVRLAA